MQPSSGSPCRSRFASELQESVTHGRLRIVVGGQYDHTPPPGRLLYEPSDDRDAGIVKAQGWLVQEKNGRISQQGCGESHALLHSRGKGRYAVIGPRQEADFVEQALDVRDVHRQAPQPLEKAQILARRHCVVEVQKRSNQADVKRSSLRSNRGARQFEYHLPFTGSGHSGQDFQQRAFARAVGPGHGETLSAGHFKREASEKHPRPETLHQARRRKPNVSVIQGAARTWLMLVPTYRSVASPLRPRLDCAPVAGYHPSKSKNYRLEIMITSSARWPLALLALLFIGVAACETDREEPTSPADTTLGTDARADTLEMAHAQLMPTEGNSASGTVTFMETAGGVRVQANLTGLTQGQHGFHVHEVGDCSAPDATSAGGHFAGVGTRHGAPTDSEMERHAGDLGNVEADAEGNATYERVDNVLSLSGPQSITGKAVLVHAEPDDLESQPSGDAGARVACGVVMSGGDMSDMGGMEDVGAMDEGASDGGVIDRPATDGVGDGGGLDEASELSDTDGV